MVRFSLCEVGQAGADDDSTAAAPSTTSPYSEEHAYVPNYIHTPSLPPYSSLARQFTFPGRPIALSLSTVMAVDLLLIHSTN